MCRMCIVEIDTGRGPALQPACMIPVAAGHEGRHRVAEVTKKAQDGVLEFLLINHPLDCPVCDKGGECPLQDQTLAYGPGESRFVEEKRHFEKPIPISDLVALDRERCILCDRCTRFANEVAGDPLIHFHGPRQPDRGQHLPRPPLRRRTSAATPCRSARSAPSPPRRTASRPGRGTSTRSSRTCTTCSVGCRIARAVEPQRGPALPGRRRRPGQLGLAVRQGPLRLRGGEQRPTASARRWLAHGRRARARCRGARRSSAAAAGARRRPTAGRGSRVLGGARLTNESAYAWAKLAKGVHRHRPRRRPARRRPARRGRARPAPRHHRRGLRARAAPCCCSAPDLKEELPVLFLRLRHAVTRDGVKVVELATQRTSVVRPRRRHAAAPPRRRRRGRARRCSPARPARRSAASSPTPSRRPARCSPPARSRSCSAAPTLAESADGVVAAAAAIHAAHPDVRFLSALRRGNVHGALDMGLAPGPAARPRHPRRRPRVVHRRGWPTVPDAARASTPPASCRPPPTARSTCSSCSAPTRSPTSPTPTSPRRGARRRPHRDRRRPLPHRLGPAGRRRAGRQRARRGRRHHHQPRGPRSARVARKITPPGTARDDWMIAAELARLLGADLGLESAGQILDEIDRRRPEPRRPHRRRCIRRRPRRRRRRRRSARGRRRRRRHAPTDRRRRRRRRPAEAAAADAAAAADDRRGAAGRRGRGHRGAGRRGRGGRRRRRRRRRRRAPPRCSRSSRADAAEPPAVDAYSLRLVATRRLYDLGTDVQHSPVARRPRQRHRAAPAPARLRPPRRRGGRRGHASPRRRARSRCRSQPDAARRARRGRRAVQPARRRPSARSSTPPRRVTEIRVVKA